MSKAQANVDYVMKRYDADNDIIHNQPNVNWADAHLAYAIEALIKRGDELESRLASIEKEVEDKDNG